MEMNEEIVQQIFDELLSSLEPLETRNAALLNLLKAKGLASDEELAPYLEQAGNASGVRWLAARIRIRSLISSAMKPTKQHVEAEGAKPKPETLEPHSETGKEAAEKAEAKADVKPEHETDDQLKAEKTVPAAAEKNESKRESAKINSESDTEKTIEDVKDKEDGKVNAA
jgi:hypothetical protein